MNYVYERDYAVLVRLKVPPGATGRDPDPRQARWLACTDKICVPEAGRSRSICRSAAASPSSARGSTNGAGRLPRPLAQPGAVRSCAATRLRVAIPLPRERRRSASPMSSRPTDGPVDYAAPQTFPPQRATADRRAPAAARRARRVRRRAGARRRARARVHGAPGAVPEGGAPVGELGARAILLAVLGAIARRDPAQPDAVRLPDPGAEGAASGPKRRRRAAQRAATPGLCRGRDRRDRRAGRAAARDPRRGQRGGLGVPAAGPAHDPAAAAARASAITLNLLGLFELPVLGGRARPTGGFATGALAAFVATPCAGPFLGAALGTALLLPPAGRCWCSPRSASAWRCRSSRSPSFPRSASGCPSPARGWSGCSASSPSRWRRPRSACLWLLWRAGGRDGACWSGWSRSAAAGAAAGRRGLLQRKGKRSASCAADGRGRGRGVAVIGCMPQRAAIAARTPPAPSRGARRAVARLAAPGPPGVRLFHRRLVPDLQGQRSRRDRPRRRCATRSARPACTCWPATGPTATRRSPASSKAAAAPACRFICGTSRASRARGTAADPDAVDAHFPRSARRASRPLPRPSCRRPRFRAPASRASACGSTGADVAVDEDEVGPFARLERCRAGPRRSRHRPRRG